jgi:hypothetical protein
MTDQRAESHSPLLDRLVHLARARGLKPKPTMTLDPDEADTLLAWLKTAWYGDGATREDRK